MKIHLVTYGLKYNNSKIIDLQIDARVLPNPFYIDNLKHKTGLDDEVYNYVFNSEEGNLFKEKISSYLDYYLEKISFHDEITIGICCTGGQHRSVAVARFINDKYKDKYIIDIIHQDSKNWK